MAWGNRKDGRAARVWTDQEKALLVSLRKEQRLPWGSIASHFPGSTSVGCQSLYARIIHQQRTCDVSRRVNKVLQRAGAQAVADRDRRMALLNERTDVTATFFGDPPPGYSALDGCERPHVIDRREIQQPAKPTLYWGRLKPEGARA